VIPPAAGPTPSETRRTRRTTERRIQLRVALTGNKRLAENVILEVRALAQRFGLGIAHVTVVSRSAAIAKTRRPSRRPHSSILRRAEVGSTAAFQALE
jgi:hypothetical protein